MNQGPINRGKMAAGKTELGGADEQKSGSESEPEKGSRKS